MKSIQEYFNLLVRKLTPIYGKGEAKSIARIVFEDAFRLFDFSSVRPFLFQQEFQSIQERLLKKEPVQYVLGQADFYGLKFKVTPDVLIPRSETEELVHWILETNQLEAPRILDIGTGSGCIPITLKKKIPLAEVMAVDISEGALAVAQENAQLNEVFVSFKQVNILNKGEWTQLPQFDIIISNPPYIPTTEASLMPHWVKDFEPSLALFVSKDDPLIFYRTISKFTLSHLDSMGFLFFEMNEFNATKVKALLMDEGYEDVELQKDLFGKERMITARIHK